MAVQIVNSLPLDCWSEYVCRHPEGNIFHTPEMFEVFQRSKGFLPELWAAVDGDRVLGLMAPVQISLFQGPLKRVTTRSVVYGGILAEPGSEGCAALDLLLRTYQCQSDRRPVFTEVRNLSPLSAEMLRILGDNRFDYEGHLNYHIDLSGGPEEIFSRIGKRTRKNIHHALNQGKVVIEEVSDPNGLRDGYALLEQTFKFARVPLADFSLFQSAFDVLSKKKMILVTLASANLVPGAVSVELLYKNVAYGWYGGMDRRGGSNAINELLIWKVLLRCRELGCTVYDFGGAGKPDVPYGVRNFKAKFGGDLLSLGRNTWARNERVFHFYRSCYAIVRNIVR